MRAISPHAEFSVRVIAGVIHRRVDTQGQVFDDELSKDVLCEFEHFAVTKEEEAAALSTFSFSGLAEGIQPVTTLGVWDSEMYQKSRNISDEERIKIEEALRAKGEATNWSRFIIVEEARLEAPWPTYDEDSAEDILAIAPRLGLQAKAVAYERENLQRREVLEGLGETVTTPPEPISVSA